MNVIRWVPVHCALCSPSQYECFSSFFLIVFPLFDLNMENTVHGNTPSIVQLLRLKDNPILVCHRK